MGKSPLAEQEFLEYDKLRQMLDYVPTNGLYDELMTKEKSVLQTVNRVVNYSNKKQLDASTFMNMSMSQHLEKFYKTFYRLFNDAFVAQTKADMVLLFWDVDILIYGGVFVVLVTLFLFFISIST
jgi:hypothetical protein